MAEELARTEREEEEKMRAEMRKVEEELRREEVDERARGKKSLEVLNRRKMKMLQVVKYKITFDPDKPVGM